MKMGLQRIGHPLHQVTHWESLHTHLLLYNWRSCKEMVVRMAIPYPLPIQKLELNFIFAKHNILVYSVFKENITP